MHVSARGERAREHSPATMRDIIEAMSGLLALQLTHDGTTALSGGHDGRLLTWDLTRQARSSSNWQTSCDVESHSG